MVGEHPRTRLASVKKAARAAPHTRQWPIDFLRADLWEMVPLLRHEILHAGQAGFSASAFYALHLLNGSEVKGQAKRQCLKYRQSVLFVAKVSTSLKELQSTSIFNGLFLFYYYFKPLFYI